VSDPPYLLPGHNQPAYTVAIVVLSEHAPQVKTMPVLPVSSPFLFW